MSSESESSTRYEPSGGVLSRDTVNEYVPDCSGVKAGRTARTSGESFAVSDADGEAAKAESLDVVAEYQVIVTQSSH